MVSVQAPKGWELGLPPAGPGSLAPPVKRLVARLLDGLFFLPVSAALIAITILVAAPHYGPLFPTSPPCDAGTTAAECPVDNRFPGFLWLELTFVGAAITSAAAYVIADATITTRWQRTPGKANDIMDTVVVTDV